MVLHTSRSALLDSLASGQVSSRALKPTKLDARTLAQQFYLALLDNNPKRYIAFCRHPGLPDNNTLVEMLKTALSSGAIVASQRLIAAGVSLQGMMSKATASDARLAHLDPRATASKFYKCDMVASVVLNAAILRAEALHRPEKGGMTNFALAVMEANSGNLSKLEAYLSVGADITWAALSKEPTSILDNLEDPVAELFSSRMPRIGTAEFTHDPFKVLRKILTERTYEDGKSLLELAAVPPAKPNFLKRMAIMGIVMPGLEKPRSLSNSSAAEETATILDTLPQITPATMDIDLFDAIVDPGPENHQRLRELIPRCNICLPHRANTHGIYYSAALETARHRMNLTAVEVLLQAGAPINQIGTYDGSRNVAAALNRVTYDYERSPDLSTLSVEELDRHKQTIRKIIDKAAETRLAAFDFYTNDQQFHFEKVIAMGPAGIAEFISYCQVGCHVLFEAITKRTPQELIARLPKKEAALFLTVLSHYNVQANPSEVRQALGEYYKVVAESVDREKVPCFLYAEDWQLKLAADAGFNLEKTAARTRKEIEKMKDQAFFVGLTDDDETLMLLYAQRVPLTPAIIDKYIAHFSTPHNERAVSRLKEIGETLNTTRQAPGSKVVGETQAATPDLGEEAAKHQTSRP